jgi:hypothetical protein
MPSFNEHLLQRARRKQTRETFLRRQKLIQRQMVASTMAPQQRQQPVQAALPITSTLLGSVVAPAVAAVHGPKDDSEKQERGQDKTTPTTADETGAGAAPTGNPQERAPAQDAGRPPTATETAAMTAASAGAAAMTSSAAKEDAGTETAVSVTNPSAAIVAQPTPPSTINETTKDKEKGKEKEKEQRPPNKVRHKWTARDDHSDFQFAANEFNVDAYAPNLVAAQEPRNEITGHLLPHKLLNTALDTNHTWDPNTIVKIIIRFPLTDEDDEDEDNGEEATNTNTNNNNNNANGHTGGGPRGKHLRRVGDTDVVAPTPQRSQREYFEEVVDWDLGDPQTLTAVAFAHKTAQDFGLAKHDMWDLQTSIELQIDQFVRSKLNYKPPIAVHEPFGLQRSDDENYNVSQVQRTSDRASSSSKRGGGRRSTGGKSRGGGGGGARRKPAARSVVHFDHSDFFINAVKKKLEIESKAQCMSCEETNGGKFNYEANAICHICHIRKPMIVKFGCGIKAHGFCDNHCQNRLSFSAADARAGVSAEALKYNNGGCCPICSMKCYCPKCLRRLDGICHEVGAACMEDKVLHPDWAMEGGAANKKEGDTKGDEENDAEDATGPVHEVDKYVIKTLEHKDILGYSTGRLQVPKITPGVRVTKASEAGGGGGESTTASVMNETTTTTAVGGGGGLRKRSRYSAFGDDDRDRDRPSARNNSGGGGRPRSSDLPYEMMDDKITHLPHGMAQADLDILGGGGRDRATTGSTTVSHKPSTQKAQEDDDEKEDTHTEYCVLCVKGSGRGGSKGMLYCDDCPRAFHPKCIRNKKLGNQGLQALQNLRFRPKEGTDGSSETSDHHQNNHHWQCPLCIRDGKVLSSDKVDGLQSMAVLEPVMSTLVYEPHFYQGFRVLCKINEILLRLMEFDFGNWFSDPVDPDVVPDYLTKITHPPMDLGTVAKKLVNGDYVAEISASNNKEAIPSPAVVVASHSDNAEANVSVQPVDAAEVKKEDEAVDHNDVTMEEAPTRDTEGKAEEAQKKNEDQNENEKAVPAEEPKMEVDITTMGEATKTKPSHQVASSNIQTPPGPGPRPRTPTRAFQGACGTHKKKPANINHVILAVLKDVELVWHNCFTYNEAGSAVYRMGQVQRHKFITLVVCSVTQDLDDSVVAQLDRYVKGLEQSRIDHEELEITADEEENEQKAKQAKAKHEAEAKLEAEAEAKHKQEADASDPVTTGEAQDSLKQEKKAPDAMEGVVEEEEQPKKDNSEENEAGLDSVKKREDEKRQKIKEKAQSKKLKVHVVCMPRSWGGKQRPIHVVDPFTLEKVQEYSNMKSAFAAFQYLEKLGHHQDVGVGNNINIIGRKSSGTGGKKSDEITSVTLLRDAIRDNGWKQTLFGYYWCFEEHHTQLLLNRNNAAHTQSFLQLAMSGDGPHDPAAGGNGGMASGAPGTPLQSSDIIGNNNIGQGTIMTPSQQQHQHHQPLQMFDIAAMDKSGFTLGHDLDIGGEEFNFLDDNLLLNTPNSPLRAAVAARMHSPLLARGNGAGVGGPSSSSLSMMRPPLDLPLPFGSGAAASGPSLPVGLGLGLLGGGRGISLHAPSTCATNGSTAPTPNSPPRPRQIQESKLGDGDSVAAAAAGVPRIPAASLLGHAVTDNNRLLAQKVPCVPGQLSLSLSASSSASKAAGAGSFVTFIEDNEKKA